MKTRRLACLLLVLGLFALPSPATARVLTGYVSITPPDFIKYTAETGSLSHNWLSTPYTDWYVVFYAPVHLPHEAVIVGATLYFKDLSVSGYVETEFMSYDMLGDPSQTICQLASSKTSAEGTSYATSDPLNFTVDNSRRTYTLMVRIYNGDEHSTYQSLFRGFMIQYQYNAASAAVIPMP